MNLHVKAIFPIPPIEQRSVVLKENTPSLTPMLLNILNKDESPCQIESNHLAYRMLASTHGDRTAEDACILECFTSITTSARL